ATLTLAGITNPAAGSYDPSGFTVKTSSDSAPASPASPVVITAGVVTGVTFAGSPQTAGATANWTVGFTPTAVGALSATKTVTATFASGFVAPASPTITLSSAFSHCSATATGSGSTVTVTLADNA